MSNKQTTHGAMPLITIQSGKFVLEHEAAKMISQIKGNIGVIAVAGLYRTGKSYILNRLLGKQDGFEIGPSINPCTKGIYTWGRPTEENKDGKKISYLLIDTEGIGSPQQSHTYDAKIFSLTLLLSSYFVYNTMGVIDERAIEELSLVANLTQNIQVKTNGNSNEKELSNYMPTFLWLLRDFALMLKDEANRPITSSQYLELALQDRPNQEDKNRMRHKLRTMFTSRDCVALVRPVSGEAELQKIDKIPYATLRPEFRTQMDKLKEKIFDEAQAKKIMGSSIDGRGFIMLIEKYLESINSGGIPTILSAWDSVSRLKTQSALEDSLEMYQLKLKEIEKQIPIDEVDLNKIEKELRRQALDHFDENSLGDVKDKYKIKLQQALDEVFHLLCERNNRQSEEFNAKLLESLYAKHVGNKLRAKQLLTVDEFTSSWQALTNVFSKNSRGANKLASWNQLTTNHLPQSIKQFVDQLTGVGNAKIDRERTQTEEVRKQLLAALKEIDRVKEEAQQVRIEAKQALKEREQLIDEVKSLKENEQGYKSQIKSLKTEIHRKNEQIGTALDKIDDKSAENDEKIQTEISALKKRHAEEIKTITKKAMKLETENLVLENECKTLERQIASLRDEPKHGTSPNNKPTANKRNKNEDIGAELATHEHEEKNRKTDRKRKRVQAEGGGEEEEHPTAKKARMEPQNMTKEELMKELTRMKVRLPVNKATKKVYVDLYNKKMNNEL